MQTPEREERRRTFDATAADYDTVRPGYPVGMYEDLISYSRLSASAQILEIGCGSGQATLPLAKLAYHITAIDSSDNLAALARRKLAPYSRVTIVTIPFEEFEGEAESYDLLLAATSLHWIDPTLRYAKPARLLKPRGTIAVARNTHPRPFTGFFLETGAVYHRLVPEWSERGSEPEDPGRTGVAELRQSELFEDVAIHRYRWSVTFTRREYQRLLHTFSDHLRLGAERLNRLCEVIGELIDSRYGGAIERPYETELLLGRKRRTP